MISDWMNLFRSSLHDPDLLFIPNQYPHFQIHQTGISYREARMEVEFENQRFLDFKLLVSQGCACTSPCYSPLKMRQALADPVVFRGEGRDENRRIVLIGFFLGDGWLKQKGVANPGGGGGCGSLPDHPECDKITVVTSRCFSGEITWRSSRLGINHRHLISGNTTCQHRRTLWSMASFSLTVLYILSLKLPELQLELKDGSKRFQQFWVVKPSFLHYVLCFVDVNENVTRL